MVSLRVDEQRGFGFPGRPHGHESVETTELFDAVLEQEGLRRKHEQFSSARSGIGLQA